MDAYKTYEQSNDPALSKMLVGLINKETDIPILRSSTSFNVLPPEAKSNLPGQKSNRAS